MAKNADDIFKIIHHTLRRSGKSPLISWRWTCPPFIDDVSIKTSMRGLMEIVQLGLMTEAIPNAPQGHRWVQRLLRKQLGAAELWVSSRQQREISYGNLMVIQCVRNNT